MCLLAVVAHIISSMSVEQNDNTYLRFTYIQDVIIFNYPYIFHKDTAAIAK